MGVVLAPVGHQREVPYQSNVGVLAGCSENHVRWWLCAFAGVHSTAKLTARASSHHRVSLRSNSEELFRFVRQLADEDFK